MKFHWWVNCGGFIEKWIILFFYFFIFNIIYWSQFFNNKCWTVISHGFFFGPGGRISFTGCAVLLSKIMDFFSKAFSRTHRVWSWILEEKKTGLWIARASSDVVCVVRSRSQALTGLLLTCRVVYVLVEVQHLLCSPVKAMINGGSSSQEARSFENNLN